MKKLILATLAILALVFVLGSVGAYENGTIGFGQMLIQAGLAVAVEWLTLSHIDRE